MRLRWLLFVTLSIFIRSSISTKKKRNVLYIVFDDLRPDLKTYGVDFMKTPYIDRLAESGGTVFENAYCQQTVCSPSRNSFTTGRRPNTTRVWNFVNHFRQAECETKRHIRYLGDVIADAGFVQTPPYGIMNKGGYAQCCTSCSGIKNCTGWSMNEGNCTLFSKIEQEVECSTNPSETEQSCVSGRRGSFPKVTTLPGVFKQNGYLTLGVGKYYHDGGGGLGVNSSVEIHPSGPGLPPLADRNYSWSDLPIQYPNQTKYEQKFGKIPFSYPNGQYLLPDDEPCKEEFDQPGQTSDFCTPPFALDGDPDTLPASRQGKTSPLCDFITKEDAIAKLRFAKDQSDPFFLVVGIKRPHLNWRYPAPYHELYSNISLPTQRILDESIDPVAFTVFPMYAPSDANQSDVVNIVRSPWESGTDRQVRLLRSHYYASVSWADYAAGQVLEELDRLELTNDTLVVLHSDHGWHLGEYAMWEKRTLWELSARVPLIIRCPWIENSPRRVKGLVELVDIYRTVLDLVGLELPKDDWQIDGVSLRPLLEGTKDKVKDVALTMYPRCVHIGMPIYGARGIPGGEDNSCLNIERTEFTWMGYTMRTERYRYTEWVAWNGSSLSPDWNNVTARELYDHKNDTGAWTNPDQFENVNLVNVVNTSLVNELSNKLRKSFGYVEM